MEETKEKIEEDRKDAQDVYMSSASPLHANQESQQDSVIIMDVHDNISQNVNPLIDDDLKKLQQDSTNANIPCIALALVRVDEINKERNTSCW